MNVRSIRSRHGFTQEEFAAIIGVSRLTIRHWESGTHTPTERHRRRVLAIDAAGTSRLSTTALDVILLAKYPDVSPPFVFRIAELLKEDGFSPTLELADALRAFADIIDSPFIGRPGK